MTPFEEMCEFKGWKTTDKFVSSNWFYEECKWITLKRDDGDTCPLFISDTGHRACQHIASISKYEESPEDIAPNLWNAYKDRMTEEELAALRKVICEEWEKVSGSDEDTLDAAFVWCKTCQGAPFWGALYDKYDGEQAPPEVIPPEYVTLGEGLAPTGPLTQQSWTDEHYDNKYILTQKDIEQGFVKIDPYFVSKMWKIGSKDDSGALWHCFKTIARFGEKNSREREIKALYAQIKCLAQIEGVVLK